MSFCDRKKQHLAQDTIKQDFLSNARQLRDILQKRIKTLQTNRQFEQGLDMMKQDFLSKTILLKNKYQKRQRELEAQLM